jgi:DNA-directed RNA polymerase subunit RPC12/RpoP
MKIRNYVEKFVFAFIVFGLLLATSSCSAMPKGTVKNVTVGTMQIVITGAGIVRSDEKTVTYKIQCQKCGHKSEEITIPIPAPDKPYTIEWVCPNCGHKQKIEIKVVSK